MKKRIHKVVRKDKDAAVVRKVNLRRRVTVLDMLARLEARVAIQDAVLKATGGTFGPALVPFMAGGVPTRHYDMSDEQAAEFRNEGHRRPR